MDMQALFLTFRFFLIFPAFWAGKAGNTAAFIPVSAGTKASGKATGAIPHIMAGVVFYQLRDSVRQAEMGIPQDVAGAE